MESSSPFSTARVVVKEAWKENIFKVVKKSFNCWQGGRAAGAHLGGGGECPGEVRPTVIVQHGGLEITLDTAKYHISKLMET